MTGIASFSASYGRSAQKRAVMMAELRRLLPRLEGQHQALPFGLAALDSHLPDGGLTCGALHEIVPARESALPAAFGFIAAVLARASSPPPERGMTAESRLVGVRTQPIIFVIPAYGLRPYGPHGRLYGHGLAALGLDPACLILVETRHRKETLWAMEEALRSAAPAAVVGVLDKLDLKLSQRLHLAATDAGRLIFLLRPAPTLESSAAATRWRVGTAEAARDRFGLYAHPRWHLHLERARNGRPGQWQVEYDHVAHRFRLAAALADPTLARGASQSQHPESQHPSQSEHSATVHCA